ncbi:hypothetical protein BJY00DRAFT_285351 [Aspergillus carlsbadensis]|nr:hypothetical protein BJY00DRAFT_285351 [Aspergillus carlsbadensis]
MPNRIINKDLVTDITNLLPPDTICTPLSSSSSRTGILRSPPSTPFIDPRTPTPKMDIGTYGSGFVQSARSHLHIGSGIVTQALSCAMLIEVQPTDAQMANGFAPAGYDHILIRAKDHLLGFGGAFLDDGESVSDVLDDDSEAGDGRSPGRRRRSPRPGDLAAGYWVNEHRCFQYGVGEVVKVWRDFKVRFVDPERGVDPDEWVKTEFRTVRFELPGEEEEEEQREKQEKQEKGKETEKGKVKEKSRAWALASRSREYVIWWKKP